MLRIMIVDDMETVKLEIKRLKLWGEKTGFIISDEAKNGEEALSKLEINSVDLVITDIKMPKVDGIELLRKITEQSLCPCVVLLSDYSEFSYARQGLVLGAFDYLNKPVSEEAFYELLQRAREFILAKRNEQERVKRLEETVEEKVELFFPASDIAQLIDQIKKCDEKVLVSASQIVDIAAANLNHDLIKIEIVLKNAMVQIVNSMLEAHKWFSKFIDVSEWQSINFYRYSELDALRACFIDAVESIADIFNTLICGNSRIDIIYQTCQYVLSNVDSEIFLKSVSDALYLNKTYLSEIFKQRTGMSFIEYLTLVKMERAKRLIKEGNLKSYEISQLLGFKDIEYFAKLFKKHTGVPPRAFRLQNSGDR